MLKNKVPVLVCIAAFNLLILSDTFSQKKLTTIIVDAGHGGTKDPGATGQYENSLRSKEKDVTLAISLKLIAELKKQMPELNVKPTRTTDIYQDPREKARIANELGGQLFLCIHADSGPLKTGSRQIGTREETRYKYTYTGKGKKRKKIPHPYTVTVPVYEYFKKPLERSGTSVWIFAPHKTSEKLQAILDGGEDFEIETDTTDAALNDFDFKKSPEGRALAQIYADRFQLRSDRLATFVNDEIEKTGRRALGVSQRQKGIWVLQATNMPAILVETGFINNPEDERYINSEKGQQEIAEAITAAVKRYKQQIENSNKPTAVAETAKPKEEKEVTAAFESRPTKEAKVLQVKSDKVRVELFDDGEVDGDNVSVYFNKNLVVNNKALTANGYVFNLELVPGKTNELVLFADNLGTIPPNTALMVITDGTSRYEVRLAADLKNNASIRFEFKQQHP
ncbi:N-acetylmuramoyl-L-alanine amidase family protein [Ferruginibacter sp. SUN106]|uniref:N-acetylmuramoyl-L-alanine amidase family protein n=1 Tax=Ferruginibacter sp. SUN106 TaxID=2978348 RepID=UPI003D368E04